jgi:hypothetical protein
VSRRRVRSTASTRCASRRSRIQLLIPLPEGASYLGFIFARAPRADAVRVALAAAHARLTFTIDAELPVLRAATQV